MELKTEQEHIKQYKHPLSSHSCLNASLMAM